MPVEGFGVTTDALKFTIKLFKTFTSFRHSTTVVPKKP